MLMTACMKNADTAQRKYENSIKSSVMLKSQQQKSRKQQNIFKFINVD